MIPFHKQASVVVVLVHGTPPAPFPEEETMDERDVREQHTEDLIQVRRVTQMHAAWTEMERGAPGAFTLQLILDNGADEYVLRPTADDVEVLQTLWKRSESVMFDLERKVLMFSSLAS
jgi:hypothetical protein